MSNELSQKEEKGLVFVMSYKYNVSCSETISKNWTPTAIDCYSIGCSCSKCNLYKIYFENNIFQCQMKQIVIELVRKYGKPILEGNKNEKIL